MQEMPAARNLALLKAGRSIAGQDRNDCDHDQKLNESKSGPRFPSSFAHRSHHDPHGTIQKLGGLNFHFSVRFVGNAVRLGPPSQRGRLLDLPVVMAGEYKMRGLEDRRSEDIFGRF